MTHEPRHWRARGGGVEAPHETSFDIVNSSVLQVQVCALGGVGLQATTTAINSTIGSARPPHVVALRDSVDPKICLPNMD